jgi:predicted dehydrogenase/threonine dehydrogenase-like Zn-dependent dehydrogenase
MKQIRQLYKDGSLESMEVPVPTIGSREVLVRSHYSFVSMGTEKMKLSEARMSIVEKAKERPDQVKQVVQTLKDQGVMPTYRKVTERLKAPTPLGYSVAGVVAGVGSQIEDIQVGQRVAAIGEAVATHAEYNAIPRGSLVVVPDGVSLEQASTVAIGSIVLQGIRQAQLELGETVGVVGLGLLGQFAVQLARANGCSVVGIDLDPSKCALALRNGADAVASPDHDEALHHALRVSGGRGVDAVLLTASAKSNDPIDLSLAMLRDCGRIVCLGNTHIELDWRRFFDKQVSFLFSRAMGPGGRDPEYVLRGNDYPVGQVRWSQLRNMECFLDLIDSGKVDLSQLITHRFPFAEAQQTFDRISDGSMANAVGIVFEYPDSEDDAPGASSRTQFFSSTAKSRETVRLGLIGAGNYAKSMLLPHLTGMRNVSLEGICTSKGMNAEALARRFNMRIATTDATALINDPHVSALMVATRHDSHAHYASEAITAGKDVYVEKPLARSQAQLDAITRALAEQRLAHPEAAPTLWLGHNRRFAALTRDVMQHFDGVAVRQIHILVHAGSVPADSWYQDSEQGGGLLFGDVCHFIDLATWLADSRPVQVQAFATADVSHREESWAVQMRYSSGGIATVHYVCGSSERYEHDLVEVVGGGRAARMIDFASLKLLGGKGNKSTKRLQRDVGQKAMLEAMVKQFSRIPGTEDQTDSFIIAGQSLLAAQQSIIESRVITLEDHFPYRPQ